MNQGIQQSTGLDEEGKIHETNSGCTDLSVRHILL